MKQSIQIDTFYKGEFMLSNGMTVRRMSEETAITAMFRVFNRNALGRFLEAVRNVHTGNYSQDDIAFILHEGHLDLRTAYGVYMSLCMEKDIRKKITWRTFYMQCSGYRTLKPNTMEAVARFVAMMIGGVFAGREIRSECGGGTGSDTLNMGKNLMANK